MLYISIFTNRCAWAQTVAGRMSHRNKIHQSRLDLKPLLTFDTYLITRRTRDSQLPSPAVLTRDAQITGVELPR